ncbi:transcriptional regulator with XRE-family HTH domain [Limimaricola variabilis]|uniref:Transcriptional regulator with XRE-family HTH domain n=1 Tax=Limimaricola variabilis TaxID=1492771 RepID=A0ABR6HTF2_9RHOB|nr:helix-turn-helix transcriptional regulator [Limimaricola variabilis]MBB3713845.1 transcriptional regulator with XRE-family HTH domain [Limimaricola variabilis]
MTHSIDKHVGARIRYARWMKGVTQEQLGNAVGCKFQQIQKYETGMNRVSASRLWDIGRALTLPVSFFFDGTEKAEPCHVAPVDRASAELLQVSRALPEEQRKALLELAKSMLGMEDPPR